MDLLSGVFMPLKSPCNPPSAHLQPNHRPQPLDVLPDFSQLHLNPPGFSLAIPKSLTSRFTPHPRQFHPSKSALSPPLSSLFPFPNPHLIIYFFMSVYEVSGKTAMARRYNTFAGITSFQP